MKTKFLFLTFFLVAISTISLCAADGSPDPVLDVAGKELRAGNSYYILPVIRGRGGGLNIQVVRNTRCPFDVIQENNELENGRALSFTPVDPKKGVIRVSTDLNIKFLDVITTCIQSAVWRLDSYNGEYVVSTNGVEGNPGRETISNWFKIEKYQGYYKLVYCPTVCQTCRPICGDIGLSIEGGIRRLVLSQEPFRVKFMKV